jgi:4-amino-4-deoxy-L-arabinose transferase-like glycosyltransferase
VTSKIEASTGPADRRWLGRLMRLAEPMAIFLAALTLNLAGNDRTGLWDRDEPRYAQCTREMQARGDWIFPTFNAEPRYHKPVLIYWLMRAGTAIGGDTPFGARLVSSLAGAGTCLLVWSWGRKMFGAGAARLAALVLATSPIMIAESKLATTDATLAFWVVGGLYALWGLGRGPSRLLASLFWISMSLAVLTKGPIGPALIAVTCALAWLWGWPALRALKRLHWKWGLIGFTALTLPWFLAITIASEGDFLRFAVGAQLVHRIASPVEEHGGFPGYYLVLSALVFYPWSALAPVGILGAWQRRKTNPNLAFLLGWIVGPLLLLECVRTKLIHYYFPAYPAAALLIAWMVGVLTRDEVGIRRWTLGRLGLGLLGGIGIVTATSLLGGAVVLPAGLRLPLFVMSMVLAAGLLAGLLSFHRGETAKAMNSLVVAMGLFMLLLGGWLIPSAEPYRTSRIVGERLAAIATEHGVDPVLFNYQEPGVVYAMKRTAGQIRNAKSLESILSDGRQVAVILEPPHQPVELRKKFGVEVTILEEYEGFSLTKGRKQKLLFALLRKPATETESTIASARDDDAPAVEQPLIK